MTTAANPGDVFWVQAAAPGTRKAVRVVEVVGDHIRAIDSTPYEAQLYPIQSKRVAVPVIFPEESCLDDIQINEYLGYLRGAIVEGSEHIGLFLEAFAPDPLWPTIKKRLWSKLSPSEQLAVRSAIAGSDFSIPPEI
jgi:hypothetical protein